MSATEQAARLIQQGAVIAYPTEGVWGLGCDPYNKEAVGRILALKQRPANKGLILLAGSFDQVIDLTRNLQSEHMALLQESWPGPHTWLLPDTEQSIPVWIKGQFDTVAVRVSAHTLVADLCQACGGMLVSTSANPADKPPALTREQVEAYFPVGIDMILPGEIGEQSGPSEIKNLMTQQVIR
jgi:L-threonylcarbamoyladenylate synthase